MQPKRKGRRKRSAATRAKMAGAQRARWAKKKGSTPEQPVAKKKGGYVSRGTRQDHRRSKKTVAKVRAGKSAPAKVAPAAKKKKRTISAAHRAKLAASAKARWARVKKGK